MCPDTLLQAFDDASNEYLVGLVNGIIDQRVEGAVPFPWPANPQAACKAEVVIMKLAPLQSGAKQ